MVPRNLWVHTALTSGPEDEPNAIVIASTCPFSPLFLHIWALSEDSLGLCHSLTGFSLSVKSMSGKCQEILSSPGKERVGQVERAAGVHGLPLLRNCLWVRQGWALLRWVASMCI